MDRRNFLRTLAATTALPGIGPVASTAEGLGVAPEAAVPARTKTNVRPKNVILIICDDLGSGDLGCYGGVLPTPHVDGLASGGMRLTRFNAGHPLCSASRAALLTGRYAPRSHTPGALFPNARGMALSEKTLADLFRAKGYRTHAIGKWHLGDKSPYMPTDRGFDSFYGVPYSDDMQPLPLWRDRTILQADANREELTQLYTKDAVAFLHGTEQKPFFLYLAYSYPHDPAQPSRGFKGRTGFGDFGDCVHEIDWSVGQIVDTLRQQHLLDDTLILFTSDHGPWFQGSAGSLRGRKGSTFEGGFRVPLIAHWPAGIAAHQVSDLWGSNLDVLPTLVALCELPPSPNPVDGIDITALLQAGQLSTTRRPVLYFSASVENQVHCIRDGKWKLRVAQTDGEIYINDWGSGEKGYWLAHPELYDVEHDVGESYDIAQRHPEIVERLRAELDRQLPSFPDSVMDAMKSLRSTPASIITPPGAAARPEGHKPAPAWVYEPPSRR
jgi:arylsulfatase A